MMRNGWIEVELGQVCERAAKVRRKQMSMDQSLLYLDIGGIDNTTNRIVDHKVYTWADAPSRAQQVVRVGDVLFSTVRTYLRNIAQVTNPKYNNEICSSGFTVIRGLQGILHSRYAFYLTLFEGFLQSLNELQTGTSYPAVRDSDVFAQTVPLAPFPEQRAIVSKIEQLFSELDSGIANLKAARKKLEIYRQAVLKRAFEGELTKEWRDKHKGLPTAEDLLQQIKEERQAYYDCQMQKWAQVIKEWETNPGKGKKPGKPKKIKNLPKLSKQELAELAKLPSKWKWVKIDSIQNHDQYSVKAGPFGSSLKKSCYVEDGYKVYGQEQVIAGNWEIGDYYVDENKYKELITCSVRPGDALISLVGTVGRVLVLPMGIKPGIINPRLIKITFSKRFYSPRFFKYYFESAYLKGLYATRSHGATMDIINLGIIQELPFPLLSLAEQSQILEQLDMHISVCDNMLANIEEGLKEAETLRQSILKKAFEGKLLSEEELEACRKEPDWEPADKLVERIKKQRNE